MLASQLEGTDRLDELFGLALQTFGSGSTFLGKRGVLLRHLIQLRNRMVDLTKPARLLQSGVRNLADQNAHVLRLSDQSSRVRPASLTCCVPVAIPRVFYWEIAHGGEFSNGSRSQDIKGLYQALTAAGIEHCLAPLVLEIKLY